MHWPCDDEADTAATWKAMEGLLAAGATKAIGVSNFNSTAIEALLKTAVTKPAANQVGFGIGHPNNATAWGSDTGTLATCKSHGITVQAYSPLRSQGSVSIFKNEVVGKVAKAHSKSPAQIALRWVTQQGVVAVTATDKPDYATEDMSIFDFELTTAEMAELAALRG